MQTIDREYSLLDIIVLEERGLLTKSEAEEIVRQRVWQYGLFSPCRSAKYRNLVEQR